MGQSSTKEGSRSSHYIPGLDGLRAFAVLAVLGYHFLPGWLPGGYIGVDVFFVISGFLITTLLIIEKARDGKVNLKKFWGRRARRLLPALLVTIALVGAIAFFVRGDILVGLDRQILGALTFSNNWVEVASGADYFAVSRDHLFTNFWSLAVEEQFYLIWPFIVAACLGISWIAARSKLSILFAGILAAGSALLMAVWFQPGEATRVYYGTDTHLFGLMIGAGLAFWTRSKTADSALRRLRQPFWWLSANKRWQHLGVIAAIGMVVLLIMMPDSSTLTYYGGLLAASLLAAMVIVAIVSAHGLLRRLFTWKPLEWIGKRSYGIYLWHWPLLVLLNQVLPQQMPWWLASTLALTITILLAALSYRYVEVPVQRDGFREFILSGFRRKGNATITAWRFWPHPAALGSMIIVALTINALATAPTKTQTQLRIEAGRQIVRASQETTPSEKLKPQTQSVAGAQTEVSPALSASLTGADMTVVGDSVTIASAPALQERFPGILIDAEISRSMRRGGFETVSALSTAGNLRKVIIVALGTNGYFGDGNLDMLISQLGGRRIILVTAHVDREWTIPNNDDVHRAAQKYPNVSVAEWDAMISQHPELLSQDNMHPTVQGGVIYADAIAAALKTKP